MSASGKFSRTAAATSKPPVVRECSKVTAISDTRWHLLTVGDARRQFTPAQISGPGAGTAALGLAAAAMPVRLGPDGAELLGEHGGAGGVGGGHPGARPQQVH